MKYPPRTVNTFITFKFNLNCIYALTTISAAIKINLIVVITIAQTVLFKIRQKAKMFDGNSTGESAKYGIMSTLHYYFGESQQTHFESAR